MTNSRDFDTKDAGARNGRRAARNFLLHDLTTIVGPDLAICCSRGRTAGSRRAEVLKLTVLRFDDIWRCIPHS